MGCLACCALDPFISVLLAVPCTGLDFGRADFARAADCSCGGGGELGCKGGVAAPGGSSADVESLVLGEGEGEEM
jgi:hypothetical protein